MNNYNQILSNKLKGVVDYAENKNKPPNYDSVISQAKKTINSQTTDALLIQQEIVNLENLHVTLHNSNQTTPVVIEVMCDTSALEQQVMDVTQKHRDLLVVKDDLNIRLITSNADVLNAQNVTNGLNAEKRMLEGLLQSSIDEKAKYEEEKNQLMAKFHEEERKKAVADTEYDRKINNCNERIAENKEDFKKWKDKSVSDYNETTEQLRQNYDKSVKNIEVIKSNETTQLKRIYDTSVKERDAYYVDKLAKKIVIQRIKHAQKLLEREKVYESQIAELTKQHTIENQILLSDAKENAEIKVKEFNDENKELEIKIDEYLAIIHLHDNNYNKSISVLEERCRQVDTENTKLEVENKELNKELQDCEINLIKKIEELIQCKRENIKLKDENQKLQDNITNIENKLGELQATNKNLLSTNERITNLLMSYEHDTENQEETDQEKQNRNAKNYVTKYDKKNNIPESSEEVPSSSPAPAAPSSAVSSAPAAPSPSSAVSSAPAAPSPSSAVSSAVSSAPAALPKKSTLVTKYQNELLKANETYNSANKTYKIAKNFVNQLKSLEVAKQDVTAAEKQIVKATENQRKESNAAGMLDSFNIIRNLTPLETLKDKAKEKLKNSQELLQKVIDAIENERKTYENLQKTLKAKTEAKTNLKRSTETYNKKIYVVGGALLLDYKIPILIGCIVVLMLILFLMYCDSHNKNSTSFCNTPRKYTKPANCSLY
jgi:hypothetical protein